VNASVVDQHLDRSVLQKGIQGTLCRVGVADVKAHCLGAAAGGADLADQVLGALAMQIGMHCHV
jgi:hypothetical protein